MNQTLDLNRKVRSGRATAVEALLLAFVLAGGAALRFYDLGGESYWLDEVTMLNVASRDLAGIAESALGGRPPVYVLALHFWMQLFGTSEFATRALSALAGSASLLLLYVVGRDLFDRQVALIATALMAVAEFHIFVSQDIRYYSFLVFFALLSYFSLYRAVERGSGRYFVLYAVSAILMFYSHTYGLFVLAVQAPYLLLRWGKVRPHIVRWLITGLVVGLAIAPATFGAFVKTATGTAGVMDWIPDPPLWFPALTLMKFVFPGRHYPAPEVFALAGLYFVAACAGFVFLAGRGPWLAAVRGLVPQVNEEIRQRNGTPLALVLLWLLGPILFPFVLSKIVDPIYVHRYTIAAAPALYLLLALGITALRRVVPVYAVLGALAILIAPGLNEYYVTDVKEQWREAATLVQSREQASDTIIFAPGESGTIEATFDWYYEGDLAACAVEAGTTAADEISAAVAPCISNGERVWVVMRGSEERIAPFQHYFFATPRQEVTLTEEHRFTDVFVYLFTVNDSARAPLNESEVAGR